MFGKKAQKTKLLSFTLLQVNVVTYGFSIWQCCKDSSMLMLGSQFFELASHLV